jgi:hypothetical protein
MRDLPTDILYLVCEELANRQDFGTLFNCAVSSKSLVTPALLWMYRYDLEHVSIDIHLHALGPTINSQLEVVRRMMPTLTRIVHVMMRHTKLKRLLPSTFSQSGLYNGSLSSDPASAIRHIPTAFTFGPSIFEILQSSSTILYFERPHKRSSPAIWLSSLKSQIRP